MTKLQRVLAVLVLAVLAAGGVVLATVGGDDESAEPSSPSTTTASTTPASTTSTSSPTSTTIAPAVEWPPLGDGGPPGAVVTPSGVVAAVEGVAGEGTYRVTTPCAATATVGGSPLHGAHVVIDPGHGGDEPGAVGPTGLQEKEVNLQVAEEVARRLEATGATVVLTRTADYRIALRSRAAVATGLQPLAFVSVHHNADPDGPFERPGSETYYQIADPESRRLAGLLHEELIGSLSMFEADWVGDTDAGAKYRPASDGGDYYGILRRTAGVPAVLAEAAFISNPTEEALLRTPAFRAAEAEAIARAVIRFVATDDPGSGFTEPYPRTVPAGPGGGIEGCVDPPLG